MKIAIQGHLDRGKEVIQILESLGGINRMDHSGHYTNYLYYICGCDNTITWTCGQPQHMNVFTLEEFEKEFPFKIGDKVITTDGTIGIINKFEPEEDHPYCIKADVGDFYWCVTSILKLYKEMKEERNITLTLDKAKEWYQKGGELKEVALQAYSEKELNPLPRSWEEFCENYPVQRGECWLDNCDAIRCSSDLKNRIFKNWIPSQKSAEAHLALIQLEQLRDYYNNNSDAWGWSYSIIKRNGIPELIRGCDHDTFLRFKNEAIAIQFLKNFKYLIEKAGDLI